MPKRVGIIDLGSNSARMAIFERTSRLGFFILREYKVKVRLGEGAYEKGGVLQDEAMQKVKAVLSEFKHYAKLYKVRKIIAAGTSALRDAPNARTFTKMLESELGIGMRIVSGQQEAFLGGLAAANLLPKISEGLCVDIGGGSTELAKIINGKITNTMSLNLGTVRLKELFYDKGDIKGAEDFIKSLISSVPEEFFAPKIIAIGGSLRSISQAIIDKTNYAFNTLHGFSYELKEHENTLKKISSAKENELKELGIKKERFDTISAGANIFKELCAKVGANSVITSGVGVREGLFLSSILAGALSFAPNFNPSLKSLQDRFCVIDNRQIVKSAKELFASLAPLHGLSKEDLEVLIVAAKIFNIGRSIGYYTEARNSAYIVRSSLLYGYTHEQICTIAALCELNGKDIQKSDLGEFGGIIASKPGDLTRLKWLSFLLGFARNLGVYEGLSLSYEKGTLIIKGASELPLLKELAKKLVTPVAFSMSFV